MTKVVEDIKLAQALRWKAGKIFQQTFPLYEHEKADEYEKKQRDKFIENFLNTHTEKPNPTYNKYVLNDYEKHLNEKHITLAF